LAGVAAFDAAGMRKNFSRGASSRLGFFYVVGGTITINATPFEGWEDLPVSISPNSLDI